MFTECKERREIPSTGQEQEGLRVFDFLYGRREIAHRFYGLPVHLFDHISGTDTGQFGRAARLNRRDNDAFLVVWQAVALEMFV